MASSIRQLRTWQSPLGSDSEVTKSTMRHGGDAFRGAIRLTEANVMAYACMHHGQAMAWPEVMKSSGWLKCFEENVQNGIFTVNQKEAKIGIHAQSSRDNSPR